MENQSTIARTLLMIEPVAFGFNPETSVNNYFQQRDEDAITTQSEALKEFTEMVEKLKSVGIQVIVEKDTLYPHTPDSIFPNNWISFHPNGKVILYPMFAENRRLERRMEVLIAVETKLGKKFQFTDYSPFEQEERYLEGTGSMVFDRKNRIAYAAISPRTDKMLFLKFCTEMNFKPVIFEATQLINNVRLPIYHTNVMMCVADDFAVACMESVENKKEREILRKELEQSGKIILEISLEQMNHFAGNMLQVKNDKDEKYLLLSQSAFNSLTKEQILFLEKRNELLIISIPTIERNGGGSVRCMAAEVY